MKAKDSIFNNHNNSGTYTDKLHHGEVRRNAKFFNDAPTSQGQNLAADKGVNGAKNIMSSRKK